MVLEASKEVPPLSSTTKPITNPLDGWSRPHWIDSPFTFSPLFWDFDTIEDKLSDHLPTSLTKKSLGFSLVGFVFYIFMFAAFGTIVMWRLRFSLWITCKRITRYASRGRYGNGGSATGRKFTTESYAIEEAHANGGVFMSLRSLPHSSLSSSRSGSTFKPLQRFNLSLPPGSSTFNPRFTSSEVLYVVGRAAMYFVTLWLFRPYWNSNRQLLHWIDNFVVLSLTRRCRELFSNQ